MDKPLLFDQTVKNVEFVFRYSGINIKSRKKIPSDYKKSLIIYIFNFIWLNSAIVGEILWCVDGERTSDDFLTIMFNAPCIIAAFSISLKCMQLVLNEKNLQELIKKLRNMERRENKRERSKDKDEIINIEKNFLDKVIKVINLLYLAVLLLFLLPPLIFISVKYLNTGELVLVLRFFMKYPFDPLEPKFWPFAYIHQLWAEIIALLYICAADYFFIICCTSIRTQFKLLQYNIENIIPKNENRRFLENNEFKAKFSELIRWHQDLIESVQILESIYSISTLLVFLSSSLILCLSGFNITMVDDFDIIIAFISFLFMSLFQVFFLCFFADLLSSASEEVTAAVYNSQWYMAEASVGKKMLIIQTRATKPCMLTAFGFADVNLNSFMRVLSTAWSYFALLQNIYGN